MKILIVEDSENLRNSIRKGLLKLNFIVDAVKNGEEALSYILAYDYDVILLDIMLPIMDGLQVLKKLRAKGILSGVIMLTALDQIDDRVKGLDYGADDYLCKPFAFKELIARINTVGKRHCKHKLRVLNFGKVVIDTKLYEVRVNDKRVHLTPNEFSIVECLALKANSVVRTEYLEEKLSTCDRFTSKNAIEVHVFNIRFKLKSCGVLDFIKTKRGVGYIVRTV